MFSDETIAYAAMRGIAEDELPLVVDGCSGGLSWLYALGGKSISVEQCCHRHDIDYQLGGTAKERKDADSRLLECAVAKAGDSAFKRFRAYVVWAAVRLFGGGYWAW
jgi:hypothetical protein